ncbi:ATP synthase F1 subunit gamma [Desulfitibacter alkalitolerans]|uniref:ATP synthase F1 subunit gamma n=1 Tax=Desulfitibacter alkalitolerans TaxID=264641 RepID=UPI0004808AF9|nr:ATP synthase F1 subunit gamma [Desulfitibacter alkalitolerans]
MAGMRDIKRRIRSVKSTQQITRAMKMVAAAKLRKAQASVIAARPYSNKLSEVMGRLSSAQNSFSHPLLEERTEGKIGFVVISADRGLCGGYNQNILRFAKDKMDAIGEDVSVICVGRKARDFFARRKYNIREYYVDLGDLPDYIQGRELAREIIKMFNTKEFKKLYLVFTEFGSAISYKPKMIPLLPIGSEANKEEKEQQIEYIYEPNSDEVLGTLLPRSVEINVFRALLEAKASEHGARMTAMGSATDNAGELIDKLVLSYNRARQAAITKEISEIVGGAAALQ